MPTPTSIGEGRAPSIAFAITLFSSPKYRKRVLEGKVALRLDQRFRQACEVNRLHLEEVISGSYLKLA